MKVRPLVTCKFAYPSIYLLTLDGDNHPYRPETGFSVADIVQDHADEGDNYNFQDSKVVSISNVGLTKSRHPADTCREA